MNALKHGVFSAEAVIRCGEGAEDPEELEALKRALTADLDPQGVLEELLVDRLVTIAWRSRRLLRYEVGRTRERADTAVSTWHGEERAASRAGEVPWTESNRLRHLYETATGAAERRQTGGPNGVPSPHGLKEVIPEREQAEQSWEETWDLVWHRDEADRCVQALSSNPELSPPNPTVATAFADAARALGINVPGILGVSDMVAVVGLIEDGGLDAAQFNRLIAAFRLGDETDGDCLERVRMWWDYRRDECQRALDARLAHEDQLTLAASLPDADTLQKISRYEGHLGREFDRTLKQLRDAQAGRRAS